VVDDACDILIVRHYLDVFVELMLGTQPIHKAPYRMAPTKLRELKEELLERGFHAFGVCHHRVHQYCM
jgi:hypothetical protein